MSIVACNMENTASNPQRGLHIDMGHLTTYLTSVKIDIIAVKIRNH